MLRRSARQALTNVQLVGVGLLLLFLLLAGKESTPRTPSPVSVKGLHVLFLEDFDQRPKLPKEQLSIFTSPALAKWLDDNVVAWRKMKTRDEVDNEPDWVKIAWKRGKDGGVLPWMGAYADSAWSEGPAPANVQAAIAYVTKIKGGGK